MNPPITPGEILLEEYFKPMGILQDAMARAIGVAPRSVAWVLARYPSRVRFPRLGEQPKRLTVKIRPASELAHAAKLKASQSKIVYLRML